MVSFWRIIFATKLKFHLVRELPFMLFFFAKKCALCDYSACRSLSLKVLVPKLF